MTRSYLIRNLIIAYRDGMITLLQLREALRQGGVL
jgi:hypothetical protein